MTKYLITSKQACLRIISHVENIDKLYLSKQVTTYQDCNQKWKKLLQFREVKLWSTLHMSPILSSFQLKVETFLSKLDKSPPI
jgi:hypothetical protein